MSGSKDVVWRQLTIQIKPRAILGATSLALRLAELWVGSFGMTYLGFSTLLNVLPIIGPTESAQAEAFSIEFQVNSVPMAQRSSSVEFRGAANNQDLLRPQNQFGAYVRGPLYSKRFEIECYGPLTHAAVMTSVAVKAFMLKFRPQLNKYLFGSVAAWENIGPFATEIYLSFSDNVYEPNNNTAPY